MGCWGKSSWGWNWGSNGAGGGRSYKKKYVKKISWARDDDDGQPAKKAFKFCGNDDWRDGWKKASKKAWSRKDRDDDDNDGGFKGWKSKGCKRWDRDEDDRGGKCWKKFNKKPVICEPEPEPEPPVEDLNNAPEIVSPSPAIVTVSNGMPGIDIATIVAVDPDGDALEFRVLDAVDTQTADGDFFSIDPQTGVLNFLQNAAPDGSQDGDSIYEVGIEVSDGALTDTILLDVAYLTGA